jgi:hypothetical protein
MKYEIIVRIRKDFTNIRELLDAMNKISNYFVDRYEGFTIEVDITHIREVKEDG